MMMATPRMLTEAMRILPPIATNPGVYRHTPSNQLSMPMMPYPPKPTDQTINMTQIAPYLSPRVKIYTPSMMMKPPTQMCNPPKMPMLHQPIKRTDLNMAKNLTQAVTHPSPRVYRYTPSMMMHPHPACPNYHHHQSPQT